MASSPDYLRLASSTTRVVAEATLDFIRDAVIIIDARSRHLPIVQANVIARQALISEHDPGSLLDTSILRLIAPASVEDLEKRIRSPESDITDRPLTWRLVSGDRALSTQTRRLDVGSSQSLYAVLFSEALPHPELGSVMEQMPMGVVIADANLQVTYVNASVRGRIQEHSGDIEEVSVLTLMPLSSLPREVLMQAIAGRSFHDDALEVRQPDGTARWFDIGVQPLKGKRGLTGLVAVYCEVTERRLRQRAQTSSERRLLALTEHARDIISIADVSGRVEYVSGGVFNSLGYSQEERRSNYIFEHMHPEDYPEVRAKFQQLVDGEIDSFAKEIRVRHRGGSYRWLESSYVAALNNPLIGGVVINSRDVTERKEAEFRLAQREEVFRLAADAVDGVIFEWDIARGVVHRSRGVQEVLGMLPEDLEASPDIWQERIHPRDFESSRRAMSLALLKGRGWATTYRIRDARGRYKSILERGLIQRGAHGDPVRAIGCAVDVSEIKRLTDLLADTQRAAKIGGWEYSFATRELAWTEEMYRIYETEAQDFTLTWESMLEQFVPNGAERFREALSRAEQGSGEFDLDLEILTRRQQRLWVRLIGHLEMLDGRPFRAYGSLQDIQAQKVSQIALENSTGWLRLSMNMAHLHAWRWDRTLDAFEFTTLGGHQVHLPVVYAGMEAMLARVHPKEQGRSNAPSTARSDSAAKCARNSGCRAPTGIIAPTPPRHGRCSTKPRCPRAWWASSKMSQGCASRSGGCASPRSCCAPPPQTPPIPWYLLDTALRVRFISDPSTGCPSSPSSARRLTYCCRRRPRARVLERLRHLLQTGETAIFDYNAQCEGQA